MTEVLLQSNLRGAKPRVVIIALILVLAILWIGYLSGLFGAKAINTVDTYSMIFVSGVAVAIFAIFYYAVRASGKATGIGNVLSTPPSTDSDIDRDYAKSIAKKQNFKIIIVILLEFVIFVLVGVYLTPHASVDTFFLGFLGLVILTIILGKLFFRTHNKQMTGG